MKKLFITIIFSLFLLLYIRAQITQTYQTSNEYFTNPEIGFFFSIDPPYTTPEQWTRALTTADIQNAKNQGIVLISMRYHLANFRDIPLSQAFLDRLKADFTIARNGGIKLIVRFAYSWVGSDKPDATKDRILAHLDQLKPVLEANQDVIAYMDAGFVGAWGQWNKSSNNLIDNWTLSLKPESREIIKKILEILPASRMIAMSYSKNKREYLNTLDPTPASEAYTGTGRSRMGFSDDGLFNDEGDMGYFDVNFPSYQGTSGIAADKIYHEKDTRYVVMTGEMSVGSGSTSYISCTNAKNTLSRYHWRCLNLNGDGAATAYDKWKADGCYDEIRRRLGYRLKLIDAQMPPSVEAGNVLTMNFRISNEGFGAVYNPRMVEVILKNTSTGTVYRSKVNTDPRTWQPGDIHQINILWNLPSTMPQGDYAVYVNLPDPTSSLYGRPEYSIRLANQNVWEASTGFNSLLYSIKVRSVATGIIAEENGKSISIYPNPANEEATIKYTSSAAEKAEIIVTDILSRVVKRQVVQLQTGTNELRMDMRDAKKGIYNIQLIFSDKQIIVRRLLINN